MPSGFSPSTVTRAASTHHRAETPDRVAHYHRGDYNPPSGLSTVAPLREARLRRVILFMVTSLDGFVCGPSGELDWENRDPEVGGFLIPELLETTDTMILGRTLFEGFAKFWPAVARDPATPEGIAGFARWVDGAAKVVFSRTLETVTWTNSRLVWADSDHAISGAIASMKQEPGGDIVLFGGARFAQTCVRLGLVDEFRFKLQSIALGAGKPLFGEITERKPLRLLRTKEFRCGVVAQYFEPRS